MAFQDATHSWPNLGLVGHYQASSSFMSYQCSVVDVSALTQHALQQLQTSKFPTLRVPAAFVSNSVAVLYHNDSPSTYGDIVAESA
jgi:hypothetical protein